MNRDGNPKFGGTRTSRSFTHHDGDGDEQHLQGADVLDVSKTTTKSKETDGESDY